MSYDAQEECALDAFDGGVDPAEVSSSRLRRRARHVPAHRRAFHRFYREHFGLVWSMVRRFGVPTAQHEDAVQEVWLVAYRRMHTLDPDASAKAWLSSITRRIASRLRRTEHRQRRKLAAIELAADRPGSGAVEARDARRLLDALLSRLDDDQRTALVLAQVHGLTGPELAQSLGIPLNTAYSRLRLARRKVESFADEVGTDEAKILQALRHGEQPPPRAAVQAWIMLLPRLASAAGGAGVAAAPGAGAVGAKAGLLASVAGGASGVKVFVLTVSVGVL
ncbi:MAG: sigma-70 family RNA polymerase sigma factor, partial [Myxococcales bacterium]|nr:sigma-70 family RNA polymerase sigma factor [Myxococcales bacterium]